LKLIGDPTPQSVIVRYELSRDVLEAPRGIEPVRHGLGACLAQGVGLGLAAPFGHRLGEIGKEHGEPEPERDLTCEQRVTGTAGEVLDEHRRRQQAANRDEAHHGVAHLHAWIEFREGIHRGLAHDGALP